ncbi:MAG: thermonuclease family protein [Candidatus Limnocylindria bacterium]
MSAVANAADGGKAGNDPGTAAAATTQATATATATATHTATHTATPSADPTATATGRPTVQPTPALGRAPIGRTAVGQVVRVVDGDTIHVAVGGETFTVRYIGVDTPETVHPSEPVGWMGPEASAANAALVAGKEVVLETDVSETDRFGRQLRYVWLAQPGSWLLVNLELVRLGFANSSSYPPDVLYQDLFRAAEREAREAGVGLWGPSPTPPPVGTAPPAGDCDPSYPDVCIPPYPPDLDCGDIPFKRFAVLAPDLHGFDGDHDGIGCES